MKKLRLIRVKEVVQVCPVLQIPDSQCDALKRFLFFCFIFWIGSSFTWFEKFLINSMSGYPVANVPPTSDTPFSQVAIVSGLSFIFVEFQVYINKYKCICTPFLLIARLVLCPAFFIYNISWLSFQISVERVLSFLFIITCFSIIWRYHDLSNHSTLDGHLG